MSDVVTLVPRAAAAREALLAAVAELHALITLDPILGASPARVYFVLNPEARQRIAASLSPSDPAGRRPAAAYALVAYDFPFALHLMKATARGVSEERAKYIAACSAGLQSEALQAAAGPFGVTATPAVAFDAAALKSIFFTSTQETVIQLFELALRP